MAVPQVISIGQVPPWLSQGGKGSAPLRIEFYRQASLQRRPIRYAHPRPDTDGNGASLWESFYFKPPISDTYQKGDDPLSSTLVTLESLYRILRWAGQDYGLRMAMTDWWFGASGTPGNLLVRWRPSDQCGVNGWGGHPLKSRWTTVGALGTDRRWANADTTLKTKTLDWFLGRTVGSEDMHILYTRKPYAKTDYGPLTIQG